MNPVKPSGIVRSNFLMVCGMVAMAAVLCGCPSDPCATVMCDEGEVCIDGTCVPDEPVIVQASVEGDAVPGGTVTVTATVTLRDGSTVQSTAWTQSNSVTATIANATAATTTVTLPNAGAYKDELYAVLTEPPISEEELPENVPVPTTEAQGGLQDRFQVVGVSPFALEEAGTVTLTVTVTTTSGTYTDEVDIMAELPWKARSSLRAVPVDVPVLLHGKTQATYDWAMTAPAGSSATLADATTQNPSFTPDASGTYTLTVTNSTVDPAEAVSLTIVAGTWEGAISGQDAEGLPLSASCTVCHNGSFAPDKFTSWSASGHAEIFSTNLDTSTHYGESCFACHMVGYDPDADNGGADEAADYDDFITAGLLNTPGDNWSTMLSQFPETAQLANVQCENCHGPQNGGAHTTGEVRMDISADVCAVCHGEPLRHGRFQQWQLSGHANYELAIEEGADESCSRCHSANGFLAWVDVLNDDDPATDPLADITVTWTTDEIHPQVCVTCHDPHDVGAVSGDETDAPVRITGDTPPLLAGFTATDVGKGAICMTCHNSRRGLRTDANFDEIAGTSEAARAPHQGPQADILMGQNAYFVTVGTRGNHSIDADVEDTCVNCHMGQTPPPDLLSYNLGGTNHTFFAADDICGACHGFDSAEFVQTGVEEDLATLQGQIEDAILSLITEQIAAGKTIDLNGEATITAAADIDTIEFGEESGRQAITVTFTDSTVVGPNRMNDITANGTELYNFADDRLVKAGWNWILVVSDKSLGAHNPTFVGLVLDGASNALTELAAE